MSDVRQQTIQIVKEKVLRRLPEPVQLASGAMSQDFVDGKRAVAHFDDLETASRAIVDALRLGVRIVGLVCFRAPRGFPPS